jgi:CBS domain-containing protein
VGAGWTSALGPTSVRPYRRETPSFTLALELEVIPVKIGSLYMSQIVRAERNHSLRSAAQRMHNDRVGSLAVFSNGSLAGIITESDLVRAISDGVDLEAAVVADYMAAEPVTADVNEDSKEVAQRMLALAVRHLPVTEQGHVVGIISIRDLAILEAWPADSHTEAPL